MASYESQNIFRTGGRRCRRTLFRPAPSPFWKMVIARSLNSGPQNGDRLVVDPSSIRGCRFSSAKMSVALHVPLPSLIIKTWPWNYCSPTRCLSFAWTCPPMSETALPCTFMQAMALLRHSHAFTCVALTSLQAAV